MLIPASEGGVLCFLYGCFTLMGDAHSKDICEDYKNTILCDVDMEYQDRYNSSFRHWCCCIFCCFYVTLGME
ncbi:anoctamin-2-like isoform X2 [Tachypleus tridentatus]|uniref:anoctamin-2-like isoform X2 n=1 Tax=Tachypleus tridentatus TaxID=6853 RepID=UPI003FD00A17